MSVFVIADLHLSTKDTLNKSMEIFGRRWECYTERLESAWRALVTPDDTVVIPGDVSWGISLEEAASDLHFIDALPGRKIIGKGNHDFWWCTKKKLDEFLLREQIHSIEFLFNNSYECENFILAGSRGWFPEDGVGVVNEEVDFEKITARELGRLRLSLTDAARRQKECGKEIIVFTHFPIVWNGKPNAPFVELLREFSIRRVYFGHIHGAYATPSVIEYEGIEFHLCAADYLSFVPKHIPPTLECECLS